MKPRLCLDLDNVLARTDDVIRKVILEFTDGRVLLEYENIVEFDYCEVKGVSFEFIFEK